MPRLPAATLFAFLFSLLVGCGDDPIGPGLDGGGFVNLDAGPDGGVDASTDAGVDAGPFDAGFDAGPFDAGFDAGPPDAGPFPAETFFIGNSFTFGGPVPDLVQDLATFSGFPEFHTEYRAVGGRSLRWHREDTSTGNAVERVDEGWDLLVLQDYSTRPTDHATLGDPEGFKEDVVWWMLRARDANPNVRTVLYETWARRYNHSIYPDGFASPTEMQAQLRFHYYDAAESYVPSALSDLREGEIRVAPAGDAWELQLTDGEPPRLHADDDYHASSSGQYLNALTIFATIFESKTIGLQPIGVDFDVAGQLQRSCDDVTGYDTLSLYYGASPTIAAGDLVTLDVGPTAESGWAGLYASLSAAGPLTTTAGESTGVRVSTWAFSGEQTGGADDNAFGYPGAVSRDSLWVGSFDGHEAAAALTPARLTLWNVPPGTYTLRLFASRDGDDDGNGRLTRYQVGSESQDLEVADNTDRQAVFAHVSPDADGTITVYVSVSPAGSARFAYLGAAELERE